MLLVYSVSVGVLLLWVKAVYLASYFAFIEMPREAERVLLAAA